MKWSRFQSAFFYVIIDKGENMDGILVINKTTGMTSHDVVNILR